VTDSNAAIKAGMIKLKGISERSPPRIKTNKTIFRAILMMVIKIHRAKDRLAGILLPAIDRSNRKLIRSEGAEMINAPTSKLINAPGSKGSFRIIEKYAKKITGCKSCASIQVLNTWLNTFML
jgi:hypothetical protein